MNTTSIRYQQTRRKLQKLAMIGLLAVTTCTYPPSLADRTKVQQQVTATISALPQATPLPTTTPSSAVFPPTIDIKADQAESTSTPIITRLTLDRAPKLNEEANLILEVAAYRDAPQTTVEIKPLEGMQVISGTLNWRGEITVDTPLRLSARIIFTQVGEYALHANALAPISADMIWGDEDSIYLTVQVEEGFFGYKNSGGSQVEAQPQPTVTATNTKP